MKCPKCECEVIESEQFCRNCGFEFNSVEEEVIDDEWAGYEDDEIEKPLSEMTDAELKEKAASLGIDTKGLSAKQIRVKIKNHPA